MKLVALVALSLFGGCTVYLDEDVGFEVDPPGPQDPLAISRTLFMSFDGVTLTPGSDDATQNVSTVVQAPATLVPYLDGDPQREAKIAAIVDEVRAVMAPFDVTVTAERPASGTYHMIVTTDVKGADIGLPDVRAIMPIQCNTVPSSVGLHIADGVELNRHVVAQHAIAMFGIFNGIPSSNLANDCMCFDGPTCFTGEPAGCVVNGANTPVAEGNGCNAGGGVMDVRARFFAQYGAAP